MIARYPGRCINCNGPIVKGQQIAGESRAYYHADCAAPAPGAVGPKDPAAAMTDKQLVLIGDLLTEREFTQGEASTLIDWLLKKPRKEVAPAVELQRRLAA